MQPLFAYGFAVSVLSAIAIIGWQFGGFAIDRAKGLETQLAETNLRLESSTRSVIELQERLAVTARRADEKVRQLKELLPIVGEATGLPNASATAPPNVVPPKGTTTDDWVIILQPKIGDSVYARRANGESKEFQLYLYFGGGDKDPVRKDGWHVICRFLKGELPEEGGPQRFRYFLFRRSPE